MVEWLPRPLCIRLCALAVGRGFKSRRVQFFSARHVWIALLLSPCMPIERRPCAAPLVHQGRAPQEWTLLSASASSRSSFGVAQSSLGAVMLQICPRPVRLVATTAALCDDGVTTRMTMVAPATMVAVKILTIVASRHRQAIGTVATTTGATTTGATTTGAAIPAAMGAAAAQVRRAPAVPAATMIMKHALFSAHNSRLK